VKSLLEAVWLLTLSTTGIPAQTGFGLAVSVIAILRGNIRSSYFFRKEKYKTGDSIILELAQEVSFLNKASILLTLDHMPENSTVVIDASKTTYIDFDVLETIREFKDVKAAQKNITVILTGFRDEYKLPNTENISPEHQQKIASGHVHTITGNHEQLLKELQLN